MANLKSHMRHFHYRRVAKDPSAEADERSGVNRDKKLNKPGREIPSQIEREAAGPLSTIVSVVYYTADPTFDGPIAGYSTAGPSINTRKPAPVAAKPNDDATDQPQPTSTPDPDPILPPTTSKVLGQVVSSGLPAAISAAPTSVPTTLAQVATANRAPSLDMSETPSPTGSAQSATTSSADSPKSSTGMSAGGKAGVAIGSILIAGALLFLILFCIKKRKNKKTVRDGRDDEKDPFSNAAAIDRSVSTRSTKITPRLSLRPVTQFLPYGNGRQQNLGIPLSNTPTQDRSTNNPFGNHAEAIDATNANGPPVVGKVTAGGKTFTPATRNAPTQHVNSATGVVTGAAGDGAAKGGFTLTRSASKLGPKPMDFTMSSASPGPPSPAGTEFSVSTEVGPPIQTSGGAAIAAAGGPPHSSVYRVQLDFKPSMEDELRLVAGQVIRILHEYDDGWAMCIRLDRSQQGVVPRTCLSARPVKPRPSQPRGSPPGMRHGLSHPGMNQGPPYQMGPGMRGPPRSPGMGQGPSMSPGLNKGRGMTPPRMQQRPASPATMHGSPRSMSPAPLRPMTPTGQRPMTPNEPPRSESPGLVQGPLRSLSPAPLQPMTSNAEIPTTADSQEPIGSKAHHDAPQSLISGDPSHSGHTLPNAASPISQEGPEAQSSNSETSSRQDGNVSPLSESLSMSPVSAPKTISRKPLPSQTLSS